MRLLLLTANGSIKDTGSLLITLSPRLPPVSVDPHVRGTLSNLAPDLSLIRTRPDETLAKQLL